MYSFVTQFRKPTILLIKVPALADWKRYPYCVEVGQSSDPDNCREIFEDDAKSLPPRLLLMRHTGRKTSVLLLERLPETIEYRVLMTVSDRLLAERLVFKS